MTPLDRLLHLLPLAAEPSSHISCFFLNPADVCLVKTELRSVVVPLC